MSIVLHISSIIEKNLVVVTREAGSHFPDRST